MNKRLTIQDLADMLAERTGKDRKNAELFLKEFITLLTQGVYTDKIVKVKGIGTFKIILVERRESIHVHTGERFMIPEHYKFSFLPDKELKDLVNKPFSFFETTELNEEVEFPDLDESLQDSRDADPEDETVEEVLPDKEATAGQGIDEPIEIQGPIGMSGRIVIGKKPSQTADPLMPPELLVGEIYRPEKPERSTTQKQPVQSDSYTLREDRTDETTPRQAAAHPEEDLAAEGSEAASSVSEKETAEERRQPKEPKHVQNKEETIEREESEEENPYLDDSEFTGENRRPSREGASFKKTVLLFFIGAILLIAGAYIYLNKDFVSGLIGGVTVPPIDTTDVSDLYDESEEAAEEEIREIAEARSIEWPAPYAETDSSSATSGLAAGDTAITPAAGSAVKAASSAGSSPASIQEAAASPTPDATPVTAPTARPTAPAQSSPQPAVSSGKPLAVVKIEPGSRLTLISLKYYGNKIFWVYLYEHNKSRIQDPNNVPIGTQIEVPAPERYGIDAHSRESINRAAVKQTEILTGE